MIDAELKNPTLPDKGICFIFENYKIRVLLEQIFLLRPGNKMRNVNTASNDSRHI